jgi:hypothetical protein
VIDSDYHGECLVALHNDASEPRTVRTGDRIAQLVLLPYLPIEFAEVAELSETERGTGGFGYDPLFLYEPLNKTFAEVTEEEKNQISHRARACEKMLEIMKGLHE